MHDLEFGWVRALETTSPFATDRIVRAVLLAGGEVNETVRVVTASGSEFVARRAPEHVADWHPTVEGQVAAIELARHAGVPVPEVVYASGRILAYRYVRGHAMTEGEARSGLARAAGALHGLMHRRAGAGLGPVQGDGSSARWTSDVVFRGVDAWVEHLLALPTSSPIQPGHVEQAAVVLESAPVEQKSRLLHGDSSRANSIVDGAEIAGIIDFDDACYGDPAGDMAWWWWNSPSTADDFVAGCEATSEPTDPATLWTSRVRLLLGLADTFAWTNPRRARRIAQLLPVAVAATRSLL